VCAARKYPSTSPFFTRAAELNLQAATTQRAPKRAEAPALKKVFDELQVSSNQSTTMGPSCCPSFRLGRRRPGVQLSLTCSSETANSSKNILSLLYISGFPTNIFSPSQSVSETKQAGAN
jgi:hypothetical protein